MELTQLIRAILTVVMNIGALIFYYMSGSDRNAVTRYSKYLVGIYTMISISQGLEFSNNFISVNIGNFIILFKYYFITLFFLY